MEVNGVFLGPAEFSVRASGEITLRHQVKTGDVLVVYSFDDAGPSRFDTYRVTDTPAGLPLRWLSATGRELTRQESESLRGFLVKETLSGI